jgi:hypothetical protein
VSDSADLLPLSVVFATPERSVEVQLALPKGSIVLDAVRAASAMPAFSGLDLECMATGVYGEQVPLTRALLAHDRVEFYVPLRVDPMEARRQRGRIRR